MSSLKHPNIYEGHILPQVGSYIYTIADEYMFGMNSEPTIKQAKVIRITITDTGVVYDIKVVGGKATIVSQDRVAFTEEEAYRIAYGRALEHAERVLENKQLLLEESEHEVSVREKDLNNYKKFVEYLEKKVKEAK